jgi:hypothetical protein
MIILMHGTGDDDSKAENWMRWVAEIMERNGRLTLTVPGVNSGEWSEVCANALLCLEQLEGMCFGVLERPRFIPPNAAPAALKQAIKRADGYTPGTELNEAVLGLESKKLPFTYIRSKLGWLAQRQRYESQSWATGIKLRVAAAALCAAIYYRRAPNPQSIRIVGHSRGGATAIALHNLLTLYGIPCNHTLTLDPCHGQKIIGKGEDYYIKVWSGNVYNIPVVKEVGNMNFTNAFGGYTRRPPITVGDGGNATVTNYAPKLPTIKHGHMGKLQSLPEANKEAARARLQSLIQRLVNRQYSSVKAHLQALFNSYVVHNSADYADRKIITDQVVKTLTS